MLSGIKKTSSLCLAVAVLLIACGSEAPLPTTDLPSTPESDADVRCVALLLDNKARCLRVATGVWEHLQAEHESPQDEEQAVRHFVEVEMRGELAVADRALAISDRLALDIADERVTQAVRDTVRAQRKLCHEIRTAWSYGDPYKSHIDNLLQELERQEREMTGLVPVNRTAAEIALASYQAELSAVQAASTPTFDSGDGWERGDVLAQRPISAAEYVRKKKAWEARKEQDRRQEIARAQRLSSLLAAREAKRQAAAAEQPETTPVAPGITVTGEKQHAGHADPARVEARARFLQRREAMQRWYPHYQGAIGDLKIALGQYKRLRKKGQERGACRVLGERARATLANQRVIGSPDPEVNDALRRALTAYQNMAKACRAGYEGQAYADYNAGQAAFTTLGKALASYDLLP